MILFTLKEINERNPVKQSERRWVNKRTLSLGCISGSLGRELLDCIPKAQASEARPSAPWGLSTKIAMATPVSISLQPAWQG